MSQPIRIAPGRAFSSSIAMALSSFALLAALCLGLDTAPASAQTLRMGGGSPPPGGSTGPSGHVRSPFRPAPPTVVNTAPGVVHQPRFFYSGSFNHGPFNRVPHAHTPFYWPPASLAIPYVTPSYGQWVPGYWAYTWVPQGQATSVWVPGYYDKDGVWVAGYHAAQVVQSGYYQPYWISGYWVP